MKIRSVHRRQSSHKENSREEHPAGPGVNVTVPAVGSPDPDRIDAPKPAHRDESRDPLPC